MIETKLVPVFAPFAKFQHFALPLVTDYALTSLLIFAFVIWLLYTIVATYHWVKYSHGSSVASTAIGMHLVVSACIFTFLLI